MTKMKYWQTVGFVLICVLSFAQKTELRQDILRIAKSVDGQVGVAIMDLSTNDSLLVNADGIFAMQSVFKFPLALAILDQVDRKKLTLSQKIKLKPGDLLPNTWSPLRDEHQAGDVLTLEEILNYTVVHSDNNGCDILFRLLKGPKKVDQYVKGLGITEIAIATNEAEMGKAWTMQFSNWCKPRAMLQLLKKFFDGQLLSVPNQKLLWQMMTETSRGNQRIKGQLPSGVEILHRPGTGDTNAEGVIGAVNDVGIVKLPNGKYFAIVVYIGRAKGTVARNEMKIAEISRVAFESKWLNR